MVKLTLHNQDESEKTFEFNGGFDIDVAFDEVTEWVRNNPDAADGMYVVDGETGCAMALVRDGRVEWNIEVGGDCLLPSGDLDTVVGEWMEVVSDWGAWE